MAAYQKAYQARPENRAAERARKASRHYLDRLTARRLERQAEDPGYTARIARQKREQYLRRQAKTNGT